MDLLLVITSAVLGMAILFGVLMLIIAKDRWKKKGNKHERGKDN